MSWKRGVYFEFIFEDVIVMIFFLRELIGRKVIVEIFDIGEGSVRILFKKFNWIDVIDLVQCGYFLSKIGKKFFERFKGLFLEVYFVGKVDGMFVYVIVVKNLFQFKSIELRDEVIRFFVKGVMILIVKNGEFVFFEDERLLRDIMEEFVMNIEEVLNFLDGDLIVVIWVENLLDVMKSVYYVVLILKNDEIFEEFKFFVR